jgi:hypothetical protein
MFQLGDEPFAAPKLRGMAVNQLLGLGQCLVVTPTNEWLEIKKVAIGADEINSIIRHSAAPMVRRERNTLSHR